MSVQNLQKKHHTLLVHSITIITTVAFNVLLLKVEIANHETQINMVLNEGKKMKSVSHYGEEEIQSKMTELQQHWQELKVCWILFIHLAIIINYDVIFRMQPMPVNSCYWIHMRHNNISLMLWKLSFE